MWCVFWIKKPSLASCTFAAYNVCSTRTEKYFQVGVEVKVEMNSFLLFKLNMSPLLFQLTVKYPLFTCITANINFTIMWKCTSNNIRLDSRACIIITHQSSDLKLPPRGESFRRHTMTQHCLHFKWTSGQVSLSIPPRCHPVNTPHSQLGEAMVANLQWRCWLTG